MKLDTSSDESEALEENIHRYVLRIENLQDVEKADHVTLSKGVLILTDDENGIATNLSKSLKSEGHNNVLVRMGEQLEKIDENTYAADLGSLESISELLNKIRQDQGSISGFAHLLPLKSIKPFSEINMAEWKEELKLEIKSLFYFAKELGDEFKEAVSEGDIFFISATCMGNIFGSAKIASEIQDFFPGQGGIAGLMKAIAHEWTDVCLKVIDFDKLDDTTASILMQELKADEGLLEIGYLNGNRYTLALESSPVDKTGSVAIKIDPSWVIMITGGARGITADVARELAKKYKPTLLLIGSSPLPELEESPETMGLNTPQELKAAIMAKLKGSGQTFSIAQVEASYTRLLKDREMRDNIANMRAFGANIHYYQMDVRDEEKFGKLIDEIYETYGRLDGVIHGAGIIEDKLIRDKTPESFSRVFDTKVDSSFILSRKLRSESLSFFVIFSSIAGRFGNRGQSDYAAANEVYNKLAIYLDQRWPGRVISTMWGPWARAGGMVSAELEKQMAKFGVELIPSSVGPKKLDQELCYGEKGQVEVIFGGSGWESQRAKKIRLEDRFVDIASNKPVLPLIEAQSNTFSQNSDGSVKLIRKLDLERDIYLKDHKLDNKPVFPMTFAMELMAEVATLGWKDLKLAEISDLKVLNGIILENGPKDLQINVKPISKESQDDILEVEMSISSGDNPQHLHYRATGKLQKELSPSIPQMAIYLEEERPFPMGVQDAYENLLFHGPIFHGITDIEGMGSNGIIGKLNPSDPRKCLNGLPKDATGLNWIIDPVLTDSGLQLILLWSRINIDVTPLPSRMALYRKFSPLTGGKVECQVHVQKSLRGNFLFSKLVFFGEDGRLLSLIEGNEAVYTKAFNRLSPQH